MKIYIYFILANFIINNPFRSPMFSTDAAYILVKVMGNWDDVFVGSWHQSRNSKARVIRPSTNMQASDGNHSLCSSQVPARDPYCRDSSTASARGMPTWAWYPCMQQKPIMDGRPEKNPPFFRGRMAPKILLIKGATCWLLLQTSLELE